jgi:DNA topoisomerase-1
MQTIQDRGYVEKRGQAMIPSFLAFAVIGLLEGHYPRLVDYNFTAAMEGQLDDIAAGDGTQLAFLTSFYFGSQDAGADAEIARAGGLKKMVTENLSAIDAREVNSIPLFVDEENRRVVVRVGKFGPYLQRRVVGAGDDAPEDKASLPDGIAPDELTPERVEELFLAGNGDRVLGQDPATGDEVTVKSGRYGPYVSAGTRNSSLFKDQSPQTLTLEQALDLLKLPRVVGKDADGNEIVARNGKFGPYISREKDSRSLGSEEQLLTITLEEALALLAQPKTRQARTAKPPLRELGADPVSQKPLVIKEGRFGAYVTDGEFNATLRRDQTPEEITLEQASQMIADKRAKGPVAKKTAAKKAPAKKATAKAAGEDGATPAKKAPAKRAVAAKKTTAAKTTAAKATPAKKAAPAKRTAPRKATTAAE